MKILIIVAIALSLGAIVIWVADFEPGFVLLQYGNWSLESSLMVFLLAIIVFMVVAYLLLRSLILIKQTPNKLLNWKEIQRHKRANRALTQGLITLEEGRWAEAERKLISHAGNSETPLLHYLAAARAAQKQHAADRRDNYLRLAHETTKGADIAVGLVQAELQISAGQKEQALATLQHLREMAPKHPYVLQLLQLQYQEMDQWQDVQAVLPDLRKRHVLEDKEVQVLGLDASVGQIKAALQRRDWPKLEQLWQKSPAHQRQNDAMLKLYIESLVRQGKIETALKMIEQFLRKDWSDVLVYQYGRLEQGDLLTRLALAEKWLKNHQDNPWLLLTLGRLAKANFLWTKAEEYLRRSIECGPCGETFQVLAEVQIAQGKSNAAAETCKAGLNLMLEKADTTIQ